MRQWRGCRRCFSGGMATGQCTLCMGAVRHMHCRTHVYTGQPLRHFIWAAATTCLPCCTDIHAHPWSRRCAARCALLCRWSATSPTRPTSCACMSPPRWPSCCSRLELSWRQRTRRQWPLSHRLCTTHAWAAAARTPSSSSSASRLWTKPTAPGRCRCVCCQGCARMHVCAVGAPARFCLLV